MGATIVAMDKTHGADPFTGDILIVDDERDIRELVSGVLTDEGYECRVAGDSGTALQMVDERRPSLVLLDVWLHGSPMDGLEVLDAIKEREPELPVIIFSGHGNIDTAVSAVSRGAMDFIEKPFNIDQLLVVIRRAMETSILRRENQQLKRGEVKCPSGRWRYRSCVAASSRSL